MNTVLTVLHVIVCVFLVAVVLLQRGKGAEIGAVFGSGASSTVFGSRGAGNFLTKLTTGSAVIFMVTSLSLSYFATSAREERLFRNLIEEEGAAPGAEEQPLFEDLGSVPLPGAAGAAAEGAADVPAAAEAEAAEGAAAADAMAEEATGVGVEEVDAVLGAAEAASEAVPEAPAAEAPPKP